MEWTPEKIKALALYLSEPWHLRSVQEAARCIEAMQERMDEIATDCALAETDNARLRKWNASMIAKAASGGTLDGYREMGAKIAALEAENERLKADMANGSFYKESDIDALQAENERLRTALTNIIALTPDNMNGWSFPASRGMVLRMRGLARTALGGTDEDKTA